VESANQTTAIAIMAKRKKESKVQKRAKLRRTNSKRPKGRQGARKTDEANGCQSQA
jgi:hypothetical protein